MLPWGVKVVVIQPSAMRTPIAMGFADAFLKTAKEASKERYDAYGDDWINTVHQTTSEGIKSLAADPLETTTAMMRALLDKDPPTRIITGKAATFLFKPLSYLSDKWRDSFLYKMSFPSKPPYALQQQQELASQTSPPPGSYSSQTRTLLPLYPHTLLPYTPFHNPTLNTYPVSSHHQALSRT
jgi:hypothetical protein